MSKGQKVNSSFVMIIAVFIITSLSALAAAGPVDLTAAVIDNRIVLCWSASVDGTGMAGYIVYRDGARIGASSATSFADGDQQPCVAHGYYVAAYDAAGNLSPASNTVNAATHGPNLAVNPGFEKGGTKGWKIETTDKTSASYAEPNTANARSGKYNLANWSKAAFNVYTYQTKKGLVNGVYTVTAWVKGSGGQACAQMEVGGYGGETMTRNIPETKTYTRIAIDGINVTNGQCTFGFRTRAKGNQWINVDDVEFYKR